MAPKAKSGYGAGLWYGSPMDKLAQIITCKKSGEKQASEKVTNQDSPMDTAGRVREELIGTIVSGGTVDVTMNLVETDLSHQALFSTSGLNDGQAHLYELRWYDMTTDPNQSSTPAIAVRFEAIMFDIPDIDFPLDKAKVLTTKFTIVGDVDYIVNGVSLST